MLDYYGSKMILFLMRILQTPDVFFFYNIDRFQMGLFDNYG